MDNLELQKVLREKYIVNGKSADTIADRDAWEAVRNTCEKMRKHFTEHERIMISVSGGSDSDCIIHLVCTYFQEFLDKCYFVFVDTGLEYKATRRHLVEIASKYGITINKIRGKSVVYSCKKYGFPILNKVKAHYIDMWRRRTPKGYYLVFEADDPKLHFRFTEAERNLARYLDDNDINVSAMCCDISKKKPLKEFKKTHSVDLSVTGERKAEGGQRAIVHTSCFEQNKDGDKYMPLFWWSDDVKAAFKLNEGIRYSDCYEVWGMKRTGCVGCPFGKNTAEELKLMYEYEPELYIACMNVFGQAYELTDRFNCRRKKCLPDFLQMTLTGEIERSESD